MNFLIWIIASSENQSLKTLGFLDQFENLWFHGKWALQKIDQVHSLNPSFQHVYGKTKFKVRRKTKNDETPIVLEMYLKMYDSYYVNQNIEITSELEISNDPSQSFKLVNQEIELWNGRIFTNSYVDKINGDVELSLKIDETSQNKTAFLNILFNEGVELNLSFDSSNDPSVNSSSIFYYSSILFWVWVIFLNELIRQTRKADESQVVAQKLSISSISLNTIWNMLLFNVHSSYALYDSQYFWLAFPTLMYFVVCIAYELTLLNICWKARFNSENNDPEEMRRQMISFYLKFYITYIVAVSLSDFVFSNWFVIVTLNGIVWIPQILRNIRRRTKDVPYPFYWVALSFSQAFMPCYFLFSPSNIFEIRSNKYAAYFLVFMHVTSILILYLQRLFGSQFIIPLKYRSVGFNYFHSIEDLEEDGEKDWAICLNKISEPENSNSSSSNDDNSRLMIYMKTPCNHSFHWSWLKRWMEMKLECPSWRSQIPVWESDNE